MRLLVVVRLGEKKNSHRRSGANNDDGDGALSFICQKKKNASGKHEKKKHWTHLVHLSSPFLLTRGTRKSLVFAIPTKGEITGERMEERMRCSDVFSFFFFLSF